MYKSLLIGSACIASLLTAPVQAQTNLASAQFRAPIKASAIITKGSQSLSVNSAPQTSDVYLMNVPLTRDQKRSLQKFKMKTNNLSATSAEPTPPTALPSKVELGMNNVPVLDQGMHGTCVTFATTAALDAVLNKGDYVSQLCSLEMGNYLETRSYYPSGWNGSWGPLVLERFDEFGIVSTTDQKTKSCAGVTQYPATDMNNTGTPMSIDDYTNMSEDITDKISWFPIINVHQRFSDNAPSDLMDRVLMGVKGALASRNAKDKLRLTFGVLLPVNHCSAGACGKFHKSDDAWVLSKSIREDDEPDFGGHEMIITGYDDNATATDNEGGTHKGLLIIRNSWSDKHGDNGDYYMSYDFFKQYALEVQVVTKE